MLSFYLAFLYGYDEFGEEYADRVLCMSQFLFDVQQKNRLAQKGLLKDSVLLVMVIKKQKKKCVPKKQRYLKN